MRMRSGFCYPSRETATERTENRRRRKRPRVSGDIAGREDLFDGIPDDLVLCILTKLAALSSSTSDLITIQITCKRMRRLGNNPVVLAGASLESMAIRARSWSESAHRFLKLCADAGNLEALYILGMIRFYCLGSTASGAALMARAAMRRHAPALYSLAVIQFNGSGAGDKAANKDLPAGAALCARAASLGHVDALRELGHCLQDGYGVRRSVADGRRFLLHANARELASYLSGRRPRSAAAAVSSLQLLSDFGCVVPPPEPHPANRFLAEWFAGGGGRGSSSSSSSRFDTGELRMCSHGGCGRPETRRHEFRRCSVCGAASYCSRACQAQDWKLVHKAHCVPMARWVELPLPNGGNGV